MSNCDKFACLRMSTGSNDLSLSTSSALMLLVSMFCCWNSFMTITSMMMMMFSGNQTKLEWRIFWWSRFYNWLPWLLFTESVKMLVCPERDQRGRTDNVTLCLSRHQVASRLADVRGEADDNQLCGPGQPDWPGNMRGRPRLVTSGQLAPRLAGWTTSHQPPDQDNYRKQTGSLLPCEPDK